jgi:molybdopterin-guanine dinucleotide biosynthesis protein A
MGTDKAMLEIDGEPLLVRSARVLSQVAGSVTVVGHPERHSGLGVPVIRVRPDDVGGVDLDYMNGVVTALEHSTAEWTLITSADMPYLTADWLLYMADRALAADVDLVTRGFCNMYRTACLPALMRALDETPNSFGHTMRYLDYLVLRPEDSLPFDPDGWLFLDVDTPRDFELARERLSSTAP